LAARKENESFGFHFFSIHDLAAHYKFSIDQSFETSSTPLWFVVLRARCGSASILPPICAGYVAFAAALSK
jgi:hypothetical protein